jgi:hypothetical protein
MAISCSGGKTTLVKWSDLQDLAYQLVLARVALNLESKVPYLRDTYPLFKQLAFESTTIRQWWQWPAGVTDPCSQVSDWWITDYTPTEAQQWAMGQSRLFFTVAEPETGADTEDGCFCCLTAQVGYADGYYYLSQTSKVKSCGTTQNFAYPCLTGTNENRKGVINTAYVTTQATLSIGRDVGAEVGGQYIVSKHVCEGSRYYINYYYVWSASRSKYELREASLWLTGFFTWDIRAADFQALWSHLNALRAASCGAKTGQFAFAGSSTAIPRYCPVRESDFVWSLKQIAPNTQPGCLEYNGSSTRLPWVTNTGGAPASSCDGLLVYCNTLKHLEAHIERLAQLEPKPTVSDCVAQVTPTVRHESVSQTKQFYHLGKLENGTYVLGSWATNRDSWVISGKLYTGEFSQPAGSGVYRGSTTDSSACTINPVSGSSSYRSVSSRKDSGAASAEGCGSSSSSISTPYNIDGSAGICGIQLVYTPYSYNGPYVKTSGQVNQCTILTGTMSESKSGVGGVNSALDITDLTPLVSSIPAFTSTFVTGGQCTSAVYAATDTSDTTVSRQAVKGRYKFVFPANVPAGYKFTWDIDVDGVLIERAYTATENQAETELFELPFYNEEFVARGPYNIRVESCIAPSLPPTKVQTRAVVKAQKNKPLRHAVGADNQPISFSASSTPAGLSFNTSTGEFTGTPSTPGTYTITVQATNSFGSASETFTIEVSDDPATAAPAIVEAPQSLSVVVADHAMFTVRATGYSLAYQWYKNEVPISGATNVTLTIESVVATDAGSYTVVVSNSYGSVTSSAAVLTVASPITITSQPVSVGVNVGGSATFSVIATGTGTLTYQWYKDGEAILGATSSSYTVVNVQPATEGDYYVWISNGFSDVISAVATLSQRTVPVITNPESGTHLTGATLSLSVSATGQPTPTIAWYKDGFPVGNGGRISGANTSTLTITNLILTDAGNYTAIATNAAGSDTSDTAVIVIHQFPVILTQPIDRIAIDGQDLTITFSVEASGFPAVSYQWYSSEGMLVNGPRIFGATTNTLILTGVILSDASAYRCEVTNAAGTVISEEVTLTVWVAPAILLHPENVVTAVGTIAEFSVSVTGVPYPTYQWRKDGVDIPGATAQGYVIESVTKDDEGAYDCVVTNGAGTVTSTAAVLQVGAAPSFSYPTATVAVSANPTDTVQLTCVLGNNPAPDPYPDLQWWKDGNMVDGAHNLMLTIPGVQESAEGQYYLRATNVFGMEQSELFVLTITNLPTILSSPVDVDALPGANVTFNVTASGPGPITYRWSKNGVNITGWLNYGGLTLLSVSATDEGTYSVEVKNSAGTVTPHPDAVLNIYDTPTITVHPVGQSVLYGQDVTLSCEATGYSPIYYQWFRNGVAVTGTAMLWTNFTWYDVTYGEAGTYYCRASNAVGYTQSNSVTVTVNTPALPEIPTNVVASHHAYPTSIRITWNAADNATDYEVWVNTEDNSDYATRLVTVSALSYDWYAYVYQVYYFWIKAKNVTGTSGFSESTTGTIQPSAPVITVPPTHPAIPTAAGTTLTLSVTAVCRYSFSYGWYKNGTPISGAYFSSLTLSNVTSADNGTYMVAVGNMYGGDSATVSLSVETPSLPTSVLVNPSNQFVAVGNQANFSVSWQGGTGPFTFQWYKGGVTIPGATEDSLVITSVTVGDSGSYTVAITNSVGTVTSAAATLTASADVVITTQPTQPATPVALGSSVSVTCAATGSPAPSYQWYKNGSIIPGATSGGLTVSNITHADEGNYFCRVTNSSSSADSNPIYISPGAVPVFVYPAASESVNKLPGATYALVADVTGDPTPSITWYKVVNGENISMGGPIYTINSVQASDAGNYFAKATNTFAPSGISSSVITLTVTNAPSIVSQPANVSVQIGQPANFSVTADTPPGYPLSYQWYKNGSAIQNATSSTFAISAVVAGDTGSYTVAVSSAAGTTTSTAATLTILTAPIITAHPNGATLQTGGSWTFNVAATSQGEISYQWKKNGAALSDDAYYLGSNTSSLILQSTKFIHAGSYTCDVSNAYGTVTSSAAVIIVNGPPVITNNPDDQTADPGDAVTFAVEAEGPASGAISYQWRKNGVIISGAAASSYTISNVTAADAGAYSCTASNEFGYATSTAANLSVNSGLVVVGQPTSILVAPYTNAAFNATVTGTEPVTWNWYKGAVLVASGTGVLASYTLVSANPADDGATFRCEFINSVGTVFTDYATLGVGVVPTVTNVPADQTRNPGGAINLSFSGSGYPTPTLSWQGPNGASGSSGSIVINSVSNAHEGTYTLRAENSHGFDTATFVITVNDLPYISAFSGNQTVNVGSGVTMTCTVTEVQGFSYAYQWFKDGEALPSTGHYIGALTSNLAFTAEMTDSGDYHCEVTNSVGTSTSAIAVFLVNGPVTISSVTGGATLEIGGNFTMEVEALGTAPITYQWKKDGSVINGATSAAYTISIAQPEDAGVYTCTVSNYFNYNTWYSTSDDVVVNVNYGPVFDSQPNNVTCLVGENAVFFAEASGYPTVSYQWYFNGSALSDIFGQISGSQTQQLTVHDAQLSDAGTYSVFATVGTTSLESNDATLDVEMSPPVITVHPSSDTVQAGSSVMLSCTATGNDLSYQWFKDGIEIPFATTVPLYINGFQAANEGGYYCAVSNAGGTVNSSVAELYLATAPVITAQPANVVVASGQLGYMTANFSITADGPPGMTYQWYKNGSAIQGAGSASLSIGWANVNDRGEYTCVVSNNWGNTESASAYLVVPPQEMVGNGSILAVTDTMLEYTLEATPMYPGEEITFTCAWYSTVPGIDFDGVNTIAGTPTAYVSAQTPVQVVVTATNAAGSTNFNHYVSVADQTPVFTSTDGDSGSVGVEYSYLLMVDHYPTNIDCAIDGRLAGLFFFNASTRLLWGTTNEPGTYTFNFTAYNTAVPSAYMTLTVVIS